MSTQDTRQSIETWLKTHQPTPTGAKQLVTRVSLSLSLSLSLALSLSLSLSLPSACCLFQNDVLYWCTIMQLMKMKLLIVYSGTIIWIWVFFFCCSLKIYLNAFMSDAALFSTHSTVFILVFLRFLGHFIIVFNRRRLCGDIENENAFSLQMFRFLCSLICLFSSW